MGMVRRLGALFGIVVAFALITGSSAVAHEEQQLAIGPVLPPFPVSADPAVSGRFGKPFEEPKIDGRRANTKCITTADGAIDCKPAAGSLAIMPDGRILYWNALEGTERVKLSIVAEAGSTGILNDQTRVLTLRGKGHRPRFRRPRPVDGGANPNGHDNHEIFPGGNSETNNDGALFCSDLVFLPDGRVLATGGTSYYLDPEIANSGLGVSELEGLENARIFDPKTNAWTQAASMKIGRWYPSMLTLADGDLFVASGVQKLLKPVYPDRPFGSGTNVTETETYDVSADRWTDNGGAAKRSLPLYPRLHLLPDGHVYYDAAGQSFNPFGQSYDMPLWNIAASYDPATRSWTSLGIPGLDGVVPDHAGLDLLQDQITDLEGLGVPGLGPDATIPGFRGSTFSLMMPLAPNADGSYTRASFLTAGGVLGYPVASPGSYVATSDSRLTTIDTAAGDSMTTEPTGDLSRPRWYSTGVLLPTGEVVAFNGSDRDAVAGPGVEYPIRQAELYDPATQTWRPIAQSHQPRTYHNTAALLPDGRVLVGGHAPITTLYLSHIQIPGGFGPNDGRDPSFEVFKPPYLFRGPRPKIVDAPARVRRGRTFEIETSVGADEVESVILMRNTALTHLIDGDQRAIELPVVARHGETLEVVAPPTAAVAPNGPYLLYLNRSDPDGPVPSKGHQLSLR
jgi:hypothetical protein